MPRTALVDEPLSIKLVGMEPRQIVIVQARMNYNYRGQRWESYATFQTDEQGAIDLSSQRPLDGTYDEVDSMGLFWSMNPIATFPSSVNIPREMTRLMALVNGQEIVSADIARLYIAPEVTKTQVRDNGLAGIFYKPAGQGTFPAIIILGGSGGGIDWQASIAGVLASHGYAVLALAHFNYPGLPPRLVGIPLEYFELAIQWLQSRNDVKANALAALGTSRGSELALILGSTFPKIKVIVAYSTTDLVGEDPNGPSWTYQNKPLQPNRAIPVENIKGAILLVSGTDDRVWGSTHASDMIIQKLRGVNYPYPFEHLSYKGAGHEIGYPYVPTKLAVQPEVHPISGRLSSKGGNVRDNAFANADSWPKVLRFLADNLK